MPLSLNIVVNVVSRGYFEAARTKLAIHIFIGNNRYGTPHNGDNSVLANVLLVARILRVYAHGSIAHYGFGACGGDGQEVITSLNIVAQIVELVVLFSVDNLFVRKGCLRDK